MKLNLAALILLLLISSCSDKGTFNFDDGSLGDTFSLEDDVTYTEIKNKIIDAKCIGCHSAARARGGVDLSSYESILAAKGDSGKVVTPNQLEASTFYLEVFNGTMPPRTPLTEEEISLVKKWIETGVKNSDGTPAPVSVVPGTPDAPVGNSVDFKKLDVDYVNLYEYILKDKCINCHNPNRARAEVDLSSYDKMFGMSEYFSTITEPGMPEQSALYTEVFKGSMPPRTKLSADEIDYIKRWIAEGAVEVAPKVLPLSQTKATFANLSERILKDKCVRCHNPEKARADVDLSTYDKMFGYSEYFSVVTEAGNPEGSSLYTEVFKGNMPPRNPLSAEEIAFIKRWISEGAPQ